MCPAVNTDGSSPRRDLDRHSWRRRNAKDRAAYVQRERDQSRRLLSRRSSSLEETSGAGKAAEVSRERESRRSGEPRPHPRRGVCCGTGGRLPGCQAALDRSLLPYSPLSGNELADASLASSQLQKSGRQVTAARRPHAARGGRGREVAGCMSSRGRVLGSQRARGLAVCVQTADDRNGDDMGG